MHTYLYYFPGILCGWSGRLEQCPTAHSFRTLYIINFQKHAQDTSFLTFVTSLTNCFAEYEQWTLYGALVLTLALLLRLIKCRFIIIIIIFRCHCHPPICVRAASAFRSHVR